MYLESGLFGISCLFAFGVMIGYIVAKERYRRSDYTKEIGDYDRS